MPTYNNTSAAPLLFALAVSQAVFSESSYGAGVLEEMVVTAQRRTESIQDVPISILAFGEEAVAAKRLINVASVVAFSPNVVLSDASPSNQSIYIRGIGSNLSEAGSENSVAMSVDEVFISRKGALTTEFFDVQRIEVLRGPQGTLYGKNVVGGAINILNNPPVMDERQARIEAGAGDYSLVEGKGMVNLPVGDTLAMRAVLNYRDRDAYIDNIWQPVDPAQTNPDPFNNYQQCKDCSGDIESPENYAGRVMLRGEPSDQFTWQLGVSYSKTRIDGIYAKVGNIISGTVGPGGPIDLTGLKTDWWEVVNGNVRGDMDQDFTLSTLKLEYQTGIGTLTSVTGGQWLDYTTDNDVINAAPQYGPVGGAGYRSEVNEDEQTDAFSQELRLSSSPDGAFTFDDQLEWLGGLYFSQEKTDRDFSRMRRITLTPTITATTSAPLFIQDTTRTSYAAFTQATYHLTDTVDLTAGARYTVDQLDFKAQVTNPLGNEPWITSLAPATAIYGPTSSTESWSEPTGQLSASYRPIEDLMLYATYSRGFKGGGFQGDANDEATAKLPFEPEFADNYEVGVKSQWFDNTLQFNLTAFYVEFNDMQLTERRELTPGDPTSVVQAIFNAANAEITGTEFEVQWHTPLEGLSLGLNGGTLDSEVKKSINPLYEDKDLPRTPDYSYTLEARYGMQLAEMGDLDFRLGYRYTGEYWWDLGELEPGYQKSIGLVDGSVSLAKDRWRITLWGKNLTEEEYYSSGFSVQSDPVTGQGGSSLNRIGDPRTYGISASYNFDL